MRWDEMGGDGRGVEILLQDCMLCAILEENLTLSRVRLIGGSGVSSTAE